jgi:hypothetical protein
MFEALVAQLLSATLGEWVEDISPERLSLGAWRGDVQLSDLRLRAGALLPGPLPLVVQSGRIGRLILQVPWAQLHAQPTILQIHELDATLALADADRAYGEPRTTLALAGGVGGVGGASEPLSPLLAKVLRNLQLIVSSVDVRIVASCALRFALPSASPPRAGARAVVFCVSVEAAFLAEHAAGGAAARPLGGGGLELERTLVLRDVVLCVRALDRPPTGAALGAWADGERARWQPGGAGARAAAGERSGAVLGPFDARVRLALAPPPPPPPPRARAHLPPRVRPPARSLPCVPLPPAHPARPPLPAPRAGPQL